MALNFMLIGLLTSTTPQDTASETVPTKSGPVLVEHVAKLEQPWGMAYLPDGQLLITEKPGRVRLFSSGKLSEPLQGLPAIEYKGQGGLLDIAVDPAFATNQFVYIFYVERAQTQPPGANDPWDPRLGDQEEKDNVLKGGAVARAKLSGNQLTDLKVIWRQVPKTLGRGHFGGRIVFAADGTLFITSGDRQRFTPAQDRQSNLGKIVRIKSDGSIPGDNPYATNNAVRHDVWSLGHRNPLGAAVNPVTKQLWINEMGPRHGDEINVPAQKKNYGWPNVSNGDNYNGVPIPDHPTSKSFEPPLYYWYPAISPSGMMFYNGDMFKEWTNNAFIGGMSSEVLVRLKLEGMKVLEEERIGLRKRIRDVAQAPDGAIMVITDYKEGELLRLSKAVR